MPRVSGLNLLRRTLLCATILTGVPGAARADIDDKTLDNNDVLPLPSGQFITPAIATGAHDPRLNPSLRSHPDFIANGAIKTAVGPDGRTLPVMTSYYNEETNTADLVDAPNHYIFVFDITGPNARNPVQVQVIQVPDTYMGLVWAPDGKKFYVSGGTGDKIWVDGGSTAAGWTVKTAIPLGHKSFAVGP